MREAAAAEATARRFLNSLKMLTASPIAIQGGRALRVGWSRKRVAFGTMALAPPPAVKMVVREYAHEHMPSATPELRTDFAETLCWRPVLVLPNGKADVSFDLCDSATTFQAIAFAHTLDGRLGAGVKIIESRLPFALQPAVPIEVTASDKIDVPLSVANNTPERRDVQVVLRTHANLKLIDGKENAHFAVDGGKTARPLYRFQPTIKEGEAMLEFTGKTEPFAYDGVRAKFHVAPEGFPIAESHSDVLEGSASQTVTLPETWVKGTLKCQVSGLSFDVGRSAKGTGSLAARAERLLRADLDEQLSQLADPRLPEGEQSDQAGGGTPRPRIAGPRLPEADLV